MTDMNKTLGGDRLGSGKKMKIHLPGYERSTHDLGYVFRTTMSAGTLVPFLGEIALPGDTWDINLGLDTKTHPTVGPLFGSAKVACDVFIAPLRLYQALLHNNQLGIGRNMSTVKLPQMEFIARVFPTDKSNLDNWDTNPSSLPAYLGVRGFGNPGIENMPRYMNAIPFLMYWEVYKNYYANKQEEIGAVIHNDNSEITATVNQIDYFVPPANNGILTKIPPGATGHFTFLTGSTLSITFTGAQPKPEELYVYMQDLGISMSLSEMFENWAIDINGRLTGTIKDNYAPVVINGWNYDVALNITQVKPVVATFPLSNIDDMRMAILAHINTTPFIINDSTAAPYGWLIDQPNGVPNILSSQEGLALKTYQSDLFNNWLKTENIDALNDATAVDTSGGSFKIEQLIMSNKLYKLLMRINVAGGSYDDWQDAVWAQERYRQCESPMYSGGLIKELIFQEVVSNSESEGQPLGTLAGKGIMAQRHKGGNITIKVDEPSFILGIVSITPRIDYSQGNKWHMNLKTMDDLHKPLLDQIGFQELITEQMHAAETTWDGTAWATNSAGKQPAWTNYMTNVNVVRGNFAIEDNEMFMVFNRRYETDSTTGAIKDLTTYIDPSKFNFIFAETALDAQNYWTQIAVDATVRRKMSHKLMPNI